MLMRHGATPVVVERMLRYRLAQRVADGVLFVEDSEVGGLTLVAPEIMQDRPLYKQLSVKGVRFKLKVYHCSWCFPSMWWELRLLAGLWGLEPKAFLANMMRNHWKRWLAILEAFEMPPELSLRRGFDRLRQDTHYMRSLPEHTISSSALLLLSAWRVFTSRGTGTRAQASDFLGAFLMLFFDGEDIELMLVLEGAGSRLGCVHSAASLAVLVDSGRVFLKPLLDALPIEKAHRLHAVMVAEDLVSQAENGVVRLDEFLLTVFAFKEKWLVRQVFGQVGKFIDVLIHEKAFSSCPLSASEDSPSLPKHARRDCQLVHKLALGEGVGDCPGRAWQQGSFVRAYELLSPPCKRMRVLTPRELNEDLMLKVLQAGQSILQTARHLSVALDGTRLGNKDVNFLAVGGFASDRRFRIMWAPVMVPGWQSAGDGRRHQPAATRKWPAPICSSRGAARLGLIRARPPHPHQFRSSSGIDWSEREPPEEPGGPILVRGRNRHFDAKPNLS